MVQEDQTKKLMLVLELVKLSSMQDLAGDAHNKILILLWASPLWARIVVLIKIIKRKKPNKLGLSG